MAEARASELHLAIEAAWSRLNTVMQTDVDLVAKERALESYTETSATLGTIQSKAVRDAMRNAIRADQHTQGRLGEELLAVALGTFFDETRQMVSDTGAPRDERPMDVDELEAALARVDITIVNTRNVVEARIKIATHQQILVLLRGQ